MIQVVYDPKFAYNFMYTYNRNKFFRGEIDKYTWVAQRPSYLSSELNTVFLYANMARRQEIYDDRIRKWRLYYDLLSLSRDFNERTRVPA